VFLLVSSFIVQIFHPSFLLNPIVSNLQATCSKFIPLLSGTKLVINCVLLGTGAFTVTYSSLLRSTVVLSQGRYMGILISLVVVFNGITGLIIWEDDIINVGGYVCVYLLFICGVYLSSDFDLLGDGGGLAGDVEAKTEMLKKVTFRKSAAVYVAEERKIYRKSHIVKLRQSQMTQSMNADMEELKMNLNKLRSSEESGDVHHLAGVIEENAGSKEVVEWENKTSKLRGGMRNLMLE